MARVAGALGADGGASSRGDLAEMVATGWRWWREELRACVPNALKARGAAAPAAFGCVLFADGRIAVSPLPEGGVFRPAESEAREVPELARGGLSALVAAAPRRTVRLSVPTELCLVRRTSIPARALSHAGAILRTEIEGLLPLPAEEILSDWYVETEDGEARQLHLVQLVLARSRIRAVREALEATGLCVVQITVGDGEGRPVPVDLTGGRDPSLRVFLARLPRGAKAMLALAALLLVAAPFIAAARQEAALASTAALRSAALASGASARPLDAAAAALEAFGRRPALAHLLDDIARRLPAGAFVTRFQAADGRILLSTAGAGDDAVRAALAKSPEFDAVEPVEGAAGTVSLRLAPPRPRAAGAAGEGP